MIDEGAVLFTPRSRDALAHELETHAAALGYRLERWAAEASASEASEGVDVELWAGEGGSAARLSDRDSGALRGLALALGGRLARSTGARVRVLLAIVTVRAADLDCTLDDVTIAKDGKRTRGRWGADLEDEHGNDWTELCDAKPYAARTALLESAMDASLPGARLAQRLVLRRPASLGSSRLDDIARRARFAERATLATVAGRRCVRITDDGATVSAFVDETEAQRLAHALGALLTTTP